MATDRLWMPSVEACYVREFDATVTSVDGDRIELDRTAFYPMGGGQPWDLGRLEGPTGGVNIASVRGREEVNIASGTVATHMRMHTAQHLISGLAYEMFGGARTAEPHSRRFSMRSNTIMAWRWGMLVQRPHRFNASATSLSLGPSPCQALRMHTAQHLISGLAYEMFGVDCGEAVVVEGSPTTRTHGQPDRCGSKSYRPEPHSVRR